MLVNTFNCFGFEMGKEHKYLKKNTANFIEWVGSELINVLQFSQHFTKLRAHET